MTEEHQADRREFLRTGAITGTALLAGTSGAFAQQTKGDIAILSFLSAVEQIESDLWLQYAELGGTQDSELPGLPTGGSAAYTAALKNLDADMDQYIHDNTEDEFSHHAFINAYLESIGATPVDLSKFQTLPSSKAKGANQIGRLTNLMQLTIDTSWWTRYRSRDQNPDIDNPSFQQAVPTLNTGQHPAIPRADNDLSPQNHIQAIANTAAFHFGSIEQGGSSLYPTLALRVTNPEVLRILLSIGPTETSHFQTWHDKAGNAVNGNAAFPSPLTDGSLVFPNLNVSPGGEDFQTNLIMPEPCPFLNRKFPPCSIIRPVSTSTAVFGAQAAVNGLVKSGLFIGQSQAFLNLVNQLAIAADAATRT